MKTKKNKPQINWPAPLAASIAGPLFFWFVVGEIQPLQRALLYVPMLNAKIFELIGWACFIIGMSITLRCIANNNARRKWLLAQKSIHDLRNMSWQNFEKLCAEIFRALGYQVIENGLAGADGGIDLLIKKEGYKAIVQCKQWEKNSVGAPIVREMYGLMTHHKVDRVKIVCCGHFTPDAINFAANKPIDLIGGPQLLQIIKEMNLLGR